MPTRINYSNDGSGATEEVAGSDKRMNVSARTDSRIYYNSRDEQEAFVLPWDDASSEAGDEVLYWKNDNVLGKHLVITAVNVNSELAASFKLHSVTGTAAGGAAATPACLNRAAPKAAAATARTAVSSPITGLTSDVELDHVSVGVDGHAEMHVFDAVRLGQDGAISIEYEQGATGRTWGSVVGYYE